MSNPSACRDIGAKRPRIRLEDRVMQLPLQISFRNMESSEAVASIIRAKAKKLDTFAPRIMGCRVVVQPAGRHHVHGNPYQVRIDLTLPGGEIAVTGRPVPTPATGTSPSPFAMPSTPPVGNWRISSATSAAR